MESVSNHKLLYQLPTDGGKTVVFSEIARRNDMVKRLSFSHIEKNYAPKHLIH